VQEDSPLHVRSSPFEVEALLSTAAGTNEEREDLEAVFSLQYPGNLLNVFPTSPPSPPPVGRYRYNGYGGCAHALRDTQGKKDGKTTVPGKFILVYQFPDYPLIRKKRAVEVESIITRSATQTELFLGNKRKTAYFAPYHIGSYPGGGKFFDTTGTDPASREGRCARIESNERLLAEDTAACRQKLGKLG